MTIPGVFPSPARGMMAIPQYFVTLAGGIVAIPPVGETWVGAGGTRRSQ